MKFTYHDDVDALFLRFSDALTLESEEVRPGVILDYDHDGHIVGIEILDATRQLTPAALSGLQAAE